MTHRTSTLESGTERGFTWYRIVGENGKTFNITFPPGADVPEELGLDSNRYTSTRGPFPFSDGSMPESSCLRDEYQFSDFDWEAWIEERVKKPATCDITLETGRYSKDIRLHATTYRRGRLEVVSRKIHGTRDPIPQIEEAYGYFERNCPAPTEAQRTAIAISKVGIGLMAAMKKQGCEIIRKWHEDNEEKDRTTTRYGYPSVSVDGTLMRATGIERVTFERETGHRQIIVKVQLEGGHRYDEDDKGATTEISGEYGDTIVSGAKGRDLGSYIGMPGTDGQKIRTSRMVHDQTSSGSKSNPRMVLRSSVENVEFIIPEVEADSDEDVMRDLVELIGPDAYFSSAEATVHLVLQRFDPRTLREILCVLKASHSVYLREYGGPMVTLKSPGGHISVEHASHDKLPSPQELYGEAA